MLTYTDAMAHMERHKDLLREVENERLAKIAVAAARALKLKLKEAKQRKEKNESAAAACCKTETA